MQVAIRFASVVDSVVLRVSRVAMCAILVIMVIGSIEVVQRTAFNSPSVWTWEYNQLILCSYIALSGAYTTLTHGHVRMDIFYGAFSPRLKALVDLILSVLFFAFILVLLWQLSKLGWCALMVRESSHSFLRTPVYPVKLLLPISVLLVLLQGIANLIRDLNTVMRGERL